MRYMIQRAKEPSTWAAIAAMLGAVAPAVPGVGGAVATVLAAGAGAVGVMLSERGGVKS